MSGCSLGGTQNDNGRVDAKSSREQRLRSYVEPAPRQDGLAAFEDAVETGNQACAAASGPGAQALCSRSEFWTCSSFDAPATGYQSRLIRDRKHPRKPPAFHGGIQ